MAIATVNPATGEISGMTTATSGNALELIVRVVDSTLPPLTGFRLAYLQIGYVRSLIRLSEGFGGFATNANFSMPMATSWL